MMLSPPAGETPAEKTVSGRETRAEPGNDAFESGLFQLLLNMPGGFAAALITDGDDQHQGGVFSGQKPLTALDTDTEAPFTNLLEKIAQSALDGNFDCTMFLPHLGEIAVSATHTQAKWTLHLEFVNQQSFDYCRTTHRRMKKELADKLGKAVQLNLLYRGRRYEDRDDD